MTPAARPIACRVLTIGRRGPLARALAETRPSGIALTQTGRPEIDVTDPARLAEVIAAARPHVVVNVAGVEVGVSASGGTGAAHGARDWAHALAVNAEGAETVARIAAEAGAAVVQISTDRVFDGTAGRPYSEGDVPGPLDVAAAAKLLGEELAMQTNPRTVVLRTARLYAPWGGTFLQRMLAGAAPERAWTSSPTSALTLARICHWIAPILAAARAGAPVWGITHCAGGGACTPVVFAEAIRRRIGTRGGARPAFAGPRPLYDAIDVTPPLGTPLDCSRLARIFGHRLPHWEIDLDEALARIGVPPVTEPA